MIRPLMLGAMTIIAMALAGFAQSSPSEIAGRTTPTNRWTVTPSLITRLAEEMRTNHPSLKAGQARTESAQASVLAVRTWEDPVLKGGVMFADVGMRADEGDILYSIEQKLPLWGKPRLEKQMVMADRDREQAQVDYQFQQLRSGLAKALFTAALSGQAIRIGEEDIAWLDTMISTLEQRYRAGEVTQVGLLRLQNDRARRLDQLTTDRRKLTHDQVTLNRLLNRGLQQAWPALDLPAPAGPIEFNDRLLDLAHQGEPKLKVFGQEIKAAEATVEATRRKSRPDVMLGVENRNYSGNGDWRQTDLMLGLNLPLWNRGRYRSEVRRDEARLEAVRHERSDYELSLAEEVHLLTVKIDAARREALLYRDEIIPRSRQAVESAQSVWTTGRGTLYELLEARRMLLEAQWMAVRAIAEQYVMLSELTLCCGLGDFEALQVINALPAQPQAVPPPK